MNMLSYFICILLYLFTSIELPLRAGFSNRSSYLSLLYGFNISQKNEILLLSVFFILFFPFLIKSIKNIDFKYRFNPLTLKASFCVITVLLLAHWVACGWLALRTETTEQPFEAYVKSLYWAVASLTTVGYGDIVPQTTAQYSYAIFVMLIGIAMYASIIGLIANFISKRDHAFYLHKERLEKLQSYLQYHQVPLSLRDRIWNYYDYLWSNKLSSEQFNMLSEIPEPIKTEVAMFLVGDLLRSSGIFANATPELVSFLAPKLRFRLSMPAEVIVRDGAAADEMYFISKGEVEVVKGGSVISRLRPGDHFGEMALLSDRTTRSASVIAKTVVEHYALDRESFNYALMLFPEFEMQIRQAVEHRLNKVAQGS